MAIGCVSPIDVVGTVAGDGASTVRSTEPPEEQAAARSARHITRAAVPRARLRRFHPGPFTGPCWHRPPPKDTAVGGDAADRRRSAVLAGHRGDQAPARALLDDADPTVRAAALGALARMGTLARPEVAAAFADPDPEVR